MYQEPVASIAHPIDISDPDGVAFAHALRLAVEFRCRLNLLHVRPPESGDSGDMFPRVRQTLIRWGMLPPDAEPADIEARLGVAVRKIAIRRYDPAQGVAEFLNKHQPDLIVMATHGRQGLDSWLSGSVSAEIARKTQLPALFFGPKAKPFVDMATGRLLLNNVAVPVADHPSPLRALDVLRRLTGKLGVSEHLVHAGNSPIRISDTSGAPLKVRTMTGPVVETILAAAETFGADLIAMPTAGQNGFLDALRGSTTEQVVRKAQLPLLALPA